MGLVLLHSSNLALLPLFRKGGIEDGRILFYALRLPIFRVFVLAF